jgi:hypothetical protein
VHLEIRAKSAYHSAIMVEWLTLLLLVPAIVLPVVLLVGFAGCNQVFGLKEVEVVGPTFDVVEAKSGTIVQLTWHSYVSGQNFVLQRFNQTNPNDPTNGSFAVTGFTFQDTNLTPATTYEYQVASRNSGDDQSFSTPPVPVQTLPFQQAFAGAVGGDDEDWEGHCLVQRIEPSRLLRSGTQVIITLLGSSSFSASIDRIYISQGFPPPGQPYDCVNTPIKVYDIADTQMPLTVNAGETVPLGQVNFILDQTKPLLIAFDFTAPPSTSGISFVPVSDGSATAYYNAATAEANQQMRSAGYMSIDTLYFIQDIEVA